MVESFENLIYVSCNPRLRNMLFVVHFHGLPRGLRSLARDLEALQSHRTLCGASSGSQTCFWGDRWLVGPSS